MPANDVNEGWGHAEVNLIEGCNGGVRLGV